MNWMEKTMQTMEQQRKDLISVDFDGVIHSYKRGWTGEIPEDPPVPGALEFIKSIIDMGYDVVIHSARAQEPKGLKGIEKWLSQHGFPDLKVTAEKPHAEAYVDDRGIRFNGDFNKVLDFIKDEHSLKPWNKK